MGLWHSLWGVAVWWHLWHPGVWHLLSKDSSQVSVVIHSTIHLKVFFGGMIHYYYSFQLNRLPSTRLKVEWKLTGTSPALCCAVSAGEHSGCAVLPRTKQQSSCGDPFCVFAWAKIMIYIYMSLDAVAGLGMCRLLHSAELCCAVMSCAVYQMLYGTVCGHAHSRSWSRWQLRISPCGSSHKQKQDFKDSSEQILWWSVDPRVWKSVLYNRVQIQCSLKALTWGNK